MSHLIAYISIGRNVNANPLPDTPWEDFQIRILQALSNPPSNATILALTTGKGIYLNQQEDTAIIMAEFPTIEYQPTLDKLLDIAAQYGQEAIGFTTTLNSLIPTTLHRHSRTTNT